MFPAFPRSPNFPAGSYPLCRAVTCCYFYDLVMIHGFLRGWRGRLRDRAAFKLLIAARSPLTNVGAVTPAKYRSTPRQFVWLLSFLSPSPSFS